MTCGPRRRAVAAMVLTEAASHSALSETVVVPAGSASCRAVSFPVPELVTERAGEVNGRAFSAGSGGARRGRRELRMSPAA